MKLPIKSVLKVLTYIIPSNTSCPIRLTTIQVIIFVTDNLILNFNIVKLIPFCTQPSMHCHVDIYTLKYLHAVESQDLGCLPWWQLRHIYTKVLTRSRKLRSWLPSMMAVKTYVSMWKTFYKYILYINYYSNMKQLTCRRIF